MSVAAAPTPAPVTVPKASDVVCLEDGMTKIIGDYAEKAGYEADQQRALSGFLSQMSRSVFAQLRKNIYVADEEMAAEESEKTIRESKIILDTYTCPAQDVCGGHARMC
jgi:hypothetical protein